MNDESFLPTTRPQCGTCKHFRAVPADMKKGQCFRYPPNAMPVPDGRGQIATWSDSPVVLRTNYCGEYTANLKAMT